MSFIYGFTEYKAKLKSCKDSSEAQIVFSVITDQVAHIKKSIEDLRQTIEEKEARLAEINIEEYKAAMVDRVREIFGK
jgi:hypothetical protein